MFHDADKFPDEYAMFCGLPEYYNAHTNVRAISVIVLRNTAKDCMLVWTPNYEKKLIFGIKKFNLEQIKFNTLKTQMPDLTC